MSSTKPKSKGISTQARYNSLGSRYKQAKTPEDYLLQRITKLGEDECWEWTKGRDRDGYGQSQGSKWSKALGTSRAHQMAYKTWVGEVSEGFVVCHKCDNPPCCNPNHLFLGTVADNNNDCISKGRNPPRMKPHKYEKEILEAWGVKSCKEVAKEFAVSFSRVCQIWRANGFKGRNF